MNTISDYSISCTAAQTQKALKLGAQIDTIGCTRGEIPLLDDYVELVVMDDNTSIIGEIPTAEEMIGWLEEKGIFIEIKRFLGRYTFILFKIYEHGEINFSIRCQDFPSRKETMLAAIDAALEYLQKND